MRCDIKKLVSFLQIFYTPKLFQSNKKYQNIYVYGQGLILIMVMACLTKNHDFLKLIG